MIDRNVEFPNRFQLQKVPGTDDIYDIIPAPGDVIAPGDLFSKGNMLPDSITAMLGLKMPNPQVADALNVLANVGNLHVWERVKQNQEAGYELGQGSLTTILSADTNTITSLSYYVSDSISVASDGTLSPVSEERVVIKFTSGTEHTGTDALKGKFGRKSQTSNIFYFFPSDCVFTDYVVTKHNIQASNAQLVTGYPAGTTTDYLTSTDRNAYTDGTVDSTTITYLGQLGEPSAKSEVGSYVGTGTYGSSNPNSLTFGFDPKFVLLMTSTSTKGNYVYSLHMLYGIGFASIYTGNGNNSGCVVTWGDRSVTWYSSGGDTNQLNSSGKTTYYIAIG